MKFYFNEIQGTTSSVPKKDEKNAYKNHQLLN